MRRSHFFFLAVFSACATYFMNLSLLEGDFIFAGFYAFILGRNLYYSYRVTKAIQLMMGSPKR